jgi:transposase-like protein
MKCPKCEKATHQHKIGTTQAGSRRYRCYFCKCSYTPEKKKQGYSESIRQKAIKLYVDGAGLRRTGRQLGVHHQSVANWAKEHAEQLPKAPVPEEVKTAEFDEIFTYIGDKKREFTSLHL